jgi:4-hydroxybenzoate polyprenyltransferase
MYAMADREDDIQVGVKSTAILFGDADRMIIGVLQALVLFTLIQVGIRESFHWPYYLGLGVATVFGLYQQFLIRQRHPQDCFRAFLNNNYIGMAVFVGIAAEHLPT